MLNHGHYSENRRINLVAAIDSIQNLQVLDALPLLSELEERLHILLPLVSLIHGHLEYLAALSAQDHLLGRCCGTKISRSTTNKRTNPIDDDDDWIERRGSEITFRDGLAVPGDGIDEEAPEAGEGLGARPPRVVVVRLGAARVDHRGDAVLAAGVQEHPVHRVVAGAAAPEVEICRRGAGR